MILLVIFFMLCFLEFSYKLDGKEEILLKIINKNHM